MNHSIKFSARHGLGLSFSVLATLALAGCNRGAGGAGGTGGADGDTLATVGTSKVTRADLTNFLVAQSGEQALPYLIDTQLLMETLKTKGLEVSDAEVDADLARRQVADPSITQLISVGGTKLETAKRQIKRDLAVQKLLTADIKVTDAQLKSFYQKNRAYYDAPAKIKTGLLFASTKVRADLMARQLSQKSRTFAALVAEQKVAKDPVASRSSADTGRFDPLGSFPPNVRTQLEKMPKGGNLAPQQINVGMPQPIYVIFHKVDFQPAKPADFAATKTQLENDYKMNEVAKKTVAANSTNPPYAETLARTQSYLQSQNPTGAAPRFHDVLSYINQTAATDLLTKLRTNGTVQVDDPTYATVAQQYKAAPAASAAAGATSGTDANSASSNTANSAAAVPAETSSPAERPANDKDTAPNGADQAAPAAVKR